MDLINSLLSGNQSTPSMIEKNIDPEKHQEIVAKLCDKRNKLEKNLQDTTILNHEDAAVELMQLRSSMAIFGITEIEYQAYISRNETEEAPATPTPQAIPSSPSFIDMEGLDSTG